MILPLELYPTIFHSLYNNGDSVALACCSLVCRSFTLKCQDLLFRWIALTVDGTDATNSRAQALEKTFSDRPDLADFVRELHITLLCGEHLATKAAFRDVFSHISHLDSFSLDCIDPKSFLHWYYFLPFDHRGFILAIERLICLPTVSRLHLSGVICPIGLFLRRNPNLKAISFNKVEVDYDDDWNSETDIVQHEIEEFTSNLFDAITFAQDMDPVGGTTLIEWAKLKILRLDCRVWTRNVMMGSIIFNQLSPILSPAKDLSTLSLSNVTDGTLVERFFQVLPLQMGLTLTWLDLSFKLEDYDTSPVRAPQGHSDNDAFLTFLNLLPTVFPPGNALQEMRIELFIAISTIPSEAWADAFVQAVTPFSFPCLKSLEVALCVVDVDGRCPNSERVGQFVQGAYTVRDAFNAAGTRIWFMPTLKYVPSFSRV